MLKENQDKFREGEGFELMVRVLKGKKFARFGALKALDYATSNSKSNCERFVEAGGLKYLFSVYMGKVHTIVLLLVLALVLIDRVIV